MNTYETTSHLRYRTGPPLLKFPVGIRPDLENNLRTNKMGDPLKFAFQKNKE